MISLLLAAAAYSKQPPVYVGVRPPVGAEAVNNPAPDESFGDWKVTYISDGSTIAVTSNSGNSTFGVFCGASGCFSFINPQISCKDGDEYPILINSPSSSFSYNVKCKKFQDLFLLALPIEGGISDAMSVGGVIGFAIPMKSGEFQVARFSLTGAARAVARAQQQVVRAGQPSPSKGDNYAL